MVIRLSEGFVGKSRPDPSWSLLQDCMDTEKLLLERKSRTALIVSSRTDTTHATGRARPERAGKSDKKYGQKHTKISSSHHNW